MVIVATILIIIGGISALMGVSLFRILLPLVGLISGVMVGFGGVQAVFGKGVISSSIAVVMAVVVGVIMALLSFAFFDLAVIILSILLGISVFTFIGVAIGVGNLGFVMFLLGLSGAVFGFIVSSSSNMSASLVITLTSMLGAAFVLAGIMLLAGTLSLNDLNNNGIVSSVLTTVDQSFLWFFVWIGATMVGINSQRVTLNKELFNNDYLYQAR